MLSSGENVEPAPIEDACMVSPFIQHMVLLGQDHRMLGALIAPSSEAFAELEHIKGEEASLPFHSSLSHVLTSCQHLFGISPQFSSWQMMAIKVSELL